MVCALAGAVGVALGCAGALPPEVEELLPPELRGLGAEPEVPATVPNDTGGDPEEAAPDVEEPEAPVEPEAPAIALPVLDGIGITVPAGAEVVSHDGSNALLVHRNGNVGKVWDAYVGSLNEAGWTRYRTPVPPFEGIFHRDERLVDLRLAQAGPTVTARFEVKVNPQAL